MKKTENGGRVAREKENVAVNKNAKESPPVENYSLNGL